MFFRRPYLTAVLVTASALFFQTPMRAQDPGQDMRGGLKTFTQVFETVESNFADTVNTDDALYKGAIPGMLRTLDPHSSFFDPKANEQFREQESGRYYGVGMYIWAPEGHVLVNYAFVGSPAFKAGLRPGDMIIQVNGKSAAKMTVTDVSNALKGPRGTPAQIVVMRTGVDHPITFNLMRDQVPRDSVTYAFWAQPGIAFIKIESFNENTSKEFGAALSKLGESNIQGLILDLRDNPGGLVEEAVNVADRLLQKGQGIVSHHGRASEETKFVAKHGEKGAAFPIVALVNGNTASAAEILSGALQDHDRAWILGETTFGKGLVQAPFPLSDSSTLLLTIAKYYTPSGRLIQRDYQHQSLYDYYNRGEAQVNLQDAKRTDSGRQVFGGDGITPDERYAPPRASRLEAELIGHLAFFYFAPEYFSTHQKLTGTDWTPDAATMQSFQQFAMSRGVAFTAAEFERDQPWIAQRLREELFITAFSKQAADRLSLQNDPELRKAIDALPQSKALLDRAKAVVARRTRPRSQTLAR